MNPPNRKYTIDRWKLDLVRARAVRLGFRGADLADVQQEVLLEVMSFQFQPARATESTVLIALIDRRLCMARRRQHRYQRHLKRIQKQMEVESCCSDAVETGHAEQINRNCDVQEIVARLEPKDQELCRMLSAGESIEAIASQLECGWHTVKRRIDRLREVIEEMGMDGYSN